ncbi:MAG: hypothetical protein EXR77_05230 [Myxococcales bacterium]|nr:hypothetical protein [Myxococcales bacterium]
MTTQAHQGNALVDGHQAPQAPLWFLQWLPLALTLVAAAAVLAAARPVVRPLALASAASVAAASSPGPSGAATVAGAATPVCRDRAWVCAPLAVLRPSQPKLGGAPRWHWQPARAVQPVKLVESQAAGLSGDATPGQPDFSAPPLGRGQPLWVSLAATWCRPCKAELADLIAAAAKMPSVSEPQHTRLLVVMGETAAGHSLARARNELLSDHAKLRPDQGRQQVPPWMQFRADLLNRWPPTLAALVGLNAEGLSLPVNAVFDGCGNLWDLHQGALKPAIVARFYQRLRWAARLRTAGKLPCHNAIDKAAKL